MYKQSVIGGVTWLGVERETTVVIAVKQRGEIGRWARLFVETEIQIVIMIK